MEIGLSMKNKLSPGLLPFFALGLGGIGLALRSWLYATGIDQNGLLNPRHPAQILLWLFTAGVMVLLFLSVRQLDNQVRYFQQFPRSLIAFIGSCAAACGILFTAVSLLFSHPDFFVTLTQILGILSFPALLITGYCRWKGIRTTFLLHVLTCIFFTLWMFSQYRNWSSDPQLSDFFFRLMACVSLTMTTYQRAAFEVKLGKRTTYVFWSLSAIFFCFVSLPAASQKLFYLSTGIYAFTQLVNIGNTHHKQEKAAPNQEL